MPATDTDALPERIDHWSAERLPALQVVRERLAAIFPAELEFRAWAVAERAARSLFVFLYTFAIEGVTECRVRPAMVTTMSDAQAAQTDVGERLRWWNAARRPRAPQHAVVGRWYAENTREPIRDETFRAWKEYGALLEDPAPTTSSVPRYRLARDFADLFDPELSGDDLDAAIRQWQERHLSPAARMRVALRRDQDVSRAGAVVRFPDGSVHPLATGPSTPLLKAAVELFAPRFLHQPVVLLVTESRRRLLHRDEAHLRRIGFVPDERVMPDLVFADVGAPGGALQLVFLECVATAGAMSRERVASLRRWLAANGFDGTRSVFGTVFSDRSDPVFRRAVGELAWGTFVWFAGEPEHLLVLYEGGAFEPQHTLDALAALSSAE